MQPGSSSIRKHAEEDEVDGSFYPLIVLTTTGGRGNKKRQGKNATCLAS